jgi:phosphate uptake regulator
LLVPELTKPDRSSHINNDVPANESTDTMETRKVQLSGGTTYTVSLPKSWAREHNIDTESLLYLRPKGDGTLVINTTGEDTSRWEVTVDVSTHSAQEAREALVAAYMTGFDRITLRDRNEFDDGSRQALTGLVSDLTGITIAETSDTRVVVRSLIDAGEISVRKSVIRLRLVTLAMQRDAATAVTESSDKLARQVVDRDTEADKLFALVTRYFRRALMDLEVVEQLGHSRPELFEYYYVARQCERIADHAEKTALLAAEQSEPLDVGFVEEYDDLAERSRTLVGNASNVVLGEAGTEMAYRSVPDCDRLVADVEAVERSLYSDKAPACAYECGILLDSVKRTAEYGANIAEIAIQRPLRRGDGNQS